MTANTCCPTCGRPLPQAAGAHFGLTVKQRAFLTFLRGYLASNNGVAPSYDEIAAAIGLKSKSGVTRFVSALSERGYVHMLRNHGRSLQLTEAGILHA